MRHWRPTVAEIDLGAIGHNVAALSALVGPRVERMAIVKANAYGHGDVEVSTACLRAGATRLGVALVEEGVRLREAGIDAPILVLVETVPAAAADVVAHRLTPTVSSADVAAALAAAATAASTTVDVHLCIDTGMHREGAAPADAVDLATAVDRAAGLRIEGIWSHLAVADEPGHQRSAEQIEAFADVCDAIGRAGVDVGIRHIANSAAIIAHPDAHLDLVRMGISLYGLPPAPAMAGDVTLRPAMRVRSAVAAVRRVEAGEGVSYGLVYAPERPSTIATVPIGYADGYARGLTGVGEMLVRGARRRVAGRVTMDQTMLDCGDEDVTVGEEVVVIGRQGDEVISADELASHLGTINYEIVSSIGPRVPREYVR